MAEANFEKPSMQQDLPYFTSAETDEIIERLVTDQPITSDEKDFVFDLHPYLFANDPDFEGDDTHASEENK